MTRQLGRKPILTFGNLSGDYPMFEFVTTGNSYPLMAFCLLCDDVEPTPTAIRSAVCGTESNGQAYTISGTPAVEQTRGIVISNHQKIIRK